MTDHLAVLKARISKTHIPQQPTEPTQAPSVGSVGDPGMGVLKNEGLNPEVCAYCRQSGETVEVFHGPAHARLHRDCIDVWIAEEESPKSNRGLISIDGKTPTPGTDRTDRSPHHPQNLQKDSH